MGGRGASFRGTTGPNPFSMQGFDPGRVGLDLYEVDTPTQRQHKIIEELKAKNIIVMTSTDKIPDEILLPNLTKVDKILSQYRFVEEDLQKQDLRIRVHAGIKTGNTVAYFGFNPVSMTKAQLGFSEVTSRKSKTEIESQTKRCVEQGSWQDCRSEDFLAYPLAHEAGHYIEYIIAKNYIDKDPKNYMLSNQLLNFKLICKKIKTEIFKIHEERFGNINKDTISEYGKTNSAEFFAETFANLHCSDNPTKLARSLDIYLRKGGKI